MSHQPGSELAHAASAERRPSRHAEHLHPSCGRFDAFADAEHTVLADRREHYDTAVAGAQHHLWRAHIAGLAGEIGAQIGPVDTAGQRAVRISYACDHGRPPALLLPISQVRVKEDVFTVG